MAGNSAITNLSVAGSVVTTHLDILGGAADASNTFATDNSVSGGTPRARRKTAAANTNSKTGAWLQVIRMAAPYVASSSFTVIVNAHVDVSPNTAKTVDVECYKLGTDGLPTGSDLCTSAAQAISTSATDYSFTIAPTTGSGTLASGERVAIVISVLVNDTGGGASDKFGFLNSARVTSLTYGSLDAIV